MISIDSFEKFHSLFIEPKRIHENSSLSLQKNDNNLSRSVKFLITE